MQSNLLCLILEVQTYYLIVKAKSYFDQYFIETNELIYKFKKAQLSQNSTSQ